MTEKKGSSSGVYRTLEGSRMGVSDLRESRYYQIRMKGLELPPLGDGDLVSFCPHLRSKDWIKDPARDNWRGAFPCERKFWLWPTDRPEGAEQVVKRVSVMDWNFILPEQARSAWLPANPHEAYELVHNIHVRPRLYEDMYLGIVVVPGAIMMVNGILQVLVIDRRQTEQASFDLRPYRTTWIEGTNFLFTKAERK